ncbi:MAG: transcription-repair coupling factor [Fibrobacterota bacterium]
MNTAPTSLDFAPIKTLLSEHTTVECAGICPGADTFLTADISRQYSTILYIAAGEKDARRLSDELSERTDRPVHLFPAAYSIPYNMKPVFGPTREKRLKTLSSLLHRTEGIIITTAAALYEGTIPPRELMSNTIRIALDDDIPLEKLESWLSENGFTRETTVHEPGQFALRGGIVDIYPLGMDNPVRIEFWGDTVESIREFDIFRQTSVEAHGEIAILPMQEFLFDDERIQQALERVEAFSRRENIPAKYTEALEHDWINADRRRALAWFIHWFDRENASLFDYLPASTLIMDDDYLSPQDRRDRILQNHRSHITRVPDSMAPFVTPPEQVVLPLQSVTALRENCTTLLMKRSAPHSAARHHFDFVPQPSFRGDLALFRNDIARKTAENYDVRIFTETEQQKNRLVQHLGEDFGGAIIPRYLQKGFFSERFKTACYSEGELFSRLTRKQTGQSGKNTAPILSYESLNPGDVVVHIDHGIALFRGITPIKAGELTTDCMILEYKNRATIHVPVTDFHKVQKYIGSRDGAAPALSTLGSSSWKRKKERTRRNLQEMAGKLIRLYALREYREGVRLGEDTDWQNTFEESFLYTPTPDQDTAVAAIKNDLESARPMDRLVCGDVGFGKTEVAMRAAFKAVMDGYQVAVLAPTTVLAAQHSETFRERMHDFPVRIALLSRLNSGAAVRRTRDDLAEGRINILIGTHKILSKSLKYENLGLIIIDEEQRFGVKQKEHFTQLRSSINVLSMSATPIPRTLHMSMAGIRDLSLINTPPRNRLPVETTVTERNDEILKGSIEDELDRGGQVFVVLNRIQGLADLNQRILQLVPTARIGLAHGQMDGEEVEEIMTRFTHGELDVLLSTAIIENGIDIPNANTIIVEEADRMGLSQLYQLRGRVGRSDLQGYAYFFVRDFARLKEDSLQRLKALEQFTDLGSGFQLAMRDLELRGAGNLLGTDQSGSIAAVGFELYCQLLKEEINKLRDTTADYTARETELKLGLNGHFPPEYIREGNLRIIMYQRTTGCTNLKEITALEKEIADRFGPLPDAVTELLLTMEIKIRARHFYISRIEQKEKKLIFTLAGESSRVQESAARFSALDPDLFHLRGHEDSLLVETMVDANNRLDTSRTVRNILKKMLYTKVKAG